MGIYPILGPPTGDASRGLGTGAIHAFFPIWLQKDFGKRTTYDGGSYWINPGAGNRNYWFAGWVLQYQVTGALSLGGEIFHQTALSTVVPAIRCTRWEPSTRPASILVGTHDFNQTYHLVFSDAA